MSGAIGEEAGDAGCSLSAYVTDAVELRIGGFVIAKSLPSVNCPGQSVSRESEAAAKPPHALCARRANRRPGLRRCR
jgi:hypothetical protein